MISEKSKRAHITWRNQETSLSNVDGDYYFFVLFLFFHRSHRLSSTRTQGVSVRLRLKLFILTLSLPGRPAAGSLTPLHSTSWLRLWNKILQNERDGILILFDSFVFFSFFLPISLYEEQRLPWQLGIIQARGSRGKVEAELSSLGGLINHSATTVQHTHSHTQSLTH